MIPGRCSACAGEAVQAPSRSWWHVGEVCPNRSMTLFRVMRWEKGGVIGPLSASELPAEFVADAAVSA